MEMKMKKQLLFFFSLTIACSGKYRAPPAVPSISLPSGTDLKPYDNSTPGLARPAGMTQLGEKAWVALGNYDGGYAIRGPAMLASFVPSAGAVALVDLGGSGDQQCKEAGWVRADGGKLYVTCSGDYHDGSGQAIVEVDPSGAGSVSRSVATPVSPSGMAVSPTRIWFGDASSGNIYAVDRGTFAVVAGPIALQCPTTGTYQTINELIVAQGDLWALCSNGDDGQINRLDAASGALKDHAAVGPIAVEMTATGDGRIAVVSGLDNKLRLVTLGSPLSVEVAYTFTGQTSTLQDVHALDQYVFTVASGSNTVQKIDLSAKGGPALVDEQNVGSGATPWTILPLDDGQALVANQGANTIVAVKWAH
jgi:DNA-binding beta-propeller fold protein YncE